MDSTAAFNQKYEAVALEQVDETVAFGQKYEPLRDLKKKFRHFNEILLLSLRLRLMLLPTKNLHKRQKLLSVTFHFSMKVM